MRSSGRSRSRPGTRRTPWPRPFSAIGDVVGSVAFAFAVTVAVAAFVVAAAALVARRRMSRRLAVAERSQVNEAARAADAEASAERFAQAFAGLEAGIVIVDEFGRTVFENPVAASMLRGSGPGALTAAAVDRLASAALAGTSADETLELYGPPRRTLHVTARPLVDGVETTGAAVVLD